MPAGQKARAALVVQGCAALNPQSSKAPSPSQSLPRPKAMSSASTLALPSQSACDTAPRLQRKPEMVCHVSLIVVALSASLA